MNEVLALLFGAGIIVLFSYDRFNLATYDGEGRLDRLITLLSPDKLRARGTVLTAYAFYVGMLLVTYLILCAYAEILPVLGGQDLRPEVGAAELPSAAATPTAFDDPAETWAQPLAGPMAPLRSLGIAPSVSLGMALIMVGFAPSFPILKRFDEWMRGLAHRLAGIPTWVIDAGDRLNTDPLFKESNQFLIAPLVPKDDRDRVQKLRKVAKLSRLKNDTDFWEDLESIVALSAWILDDKVVLSRSQTRFARVEKGLHDRVEALFQQIDGIIRGGGFAPVDSPEAPPEIPLARADPALDSPAAAAAEQQVPGAGTVVAAAQTEGEPSGGAANRSVGLPRTAPIVRLVDDLATDLRILVALYVDHRIIDLHEPSGEENPKTKTNQHGAAKKALWIYAKAARSKTKGSRDMSSAIAAWLWTVGVSLLLTMMWSLTFARYEVILQLDAGRSAGWRLLNYSFAALNIYGVTLLIALAVRDGYRHQKQGWVDTMAWADWTVWLPQRLFAVAAAAIGGAFFIGGVGLWTFATEQGGNFFGSAARTFSYNFPAALRGAILALIVIALIDRCGRSAATDKPAERSSEFWSSVCRALFAAVAMAVVGLVTRSLTAMAAGRVLWEFDEKDSGVVLYAVIQAALVGFWVVFCVSEAMFHKMRHLQSEPPEPDKASESSSGPAGTTAQVALLVFAWAAGSMPLLAAPPEILVAVRQDARPFVSIPAPGEQPVGFLWDVCSKALKLAGYHATILPIDAGDREKLLTQGETRDGLTPDLVCDPTTITLARMENFDNENGSAKHMSFSPIVFIATASYVQMKNPADPASGYITAVQARSQPTSRADFCARIGANLFKEISGLPVEPKKVERKWNDPEFFPADPSQPDKEKGLPYAVWGYVKGSTIGDAIRSAVDRVGQRQIVCAVPLRSHAMAAKRFCEGRILRYFGDLEIIRAALDQQFRETHSRCETDQNDNVGATYEPYAFMLSSACRPEFPERFTRALYEMFSDKLMDEPLARNLPGVESDYLKTLFRINAIPAGVGTDRSRIEARANTATFIPPGCRTAP
ncbi:MAG: hypothetical protein ABTQ27_13760 [Amaricoccus sp.]|uniref:hypothetical protein n=1 Tax=Amaricoccus sp. TaxID=1872485 RepID=UPI003315B72C